MIKKTKKISYEKEADVLRVELSGAPIDYAEELGPFIVHYTKKRIPVYIELLGASRFLKESQRAFIREGLMIPQQTPAAALGASR
jgi:hypothetical protein